MKLWERSLFFRLCKTKSFLLLCLFSLYLIADLTLHSVRFFSKGTLNISDLFLYYLYSFSLHLDLFLSLSFLLSALIILFEGSSHLEFVSLQMAGISKSRIGRPFLILALLSISLSYANSEWLFPRAIDSIDSFRNQHAKRKKSILREHVQTVSLEDGSEIVYLRFDAASKTISDLYWLCGKDEVWHIKTLDLSKSPPIAYFADRLVRTPQKKIAVVDSFEKIPIQKFPLSEGTPLNRFTPFESRPLSVLFSQMGLKSGDQAMIRSHLHYKLSLPLSPLFFALALPPLLIRFSRTKASFLITGGSIFGLISLFMVFDGMLIVAENRMLPPALALWIPWLLCIFFALYRTHMKIWFSTGVKALTSKRS